MDTLTFVSRFYFTFGSKMLDIPRKEVAAYLLAEDRPRKPSPIVTDTLLRKALQDVVFPWLRRRRRPLSSAERFVIGSCVLPTLQTVLLDVLVHDQDTGFAAGKATYTAKQWQHLGRGLAGLARITGYFPAVTRILPAIQEAGIDTWGVPNNPASGDAVCVDSRAFGHLVKPLASTVYGRTMIEEYATVEEVSEEQRSACMMADLIVEFHEGVDVDLDTVESLIGDKSPEELARYLNLVSLAEHTYHG